VKIIYSDKRFSSKSLRLIEQANEIIEEYESAGYDLTLRQLYYQFVSRGLIPNNQREYKNLGSVVNDGRLAGRISWLAIVDRTRAVRRPSTWDSPSSILQVAADSYAIDRWDRKFQTTRVEVWIEKDALVGVFEPICREWQVPLFSCRGYTSQSAMWSAAKRFMNNYENYQDTLILHFGDHDPSGLDMTQDIIGRMETFGARVEVMRLALNMDQVREYGPPPNPAKLTDSRIGGYLANYGEESWELDALEPKVLSRLVVDGIKSVLSKDAWSAALAREEQGRDEIIKAITNIGARE